MSANTRKKYMIIAFATLITIIIALVSIVAVFAANIQDLKSQVNIKYTPSTGGGTDPTPPPGPSDKNPIITDTYNPTAVNLSFGEIDAQFRVVENGITNADGILTNLNYDEMYNYYEDDSFVFTFPYNYDYNNLSFDSDLLNGGPDRIEWFPEHVVEITIPDHIPVIEPYAFHDLPNLQKVTINNSSNLGLFISPNAFVNCPSLTQITINAYKLFITDGIVSSDMEPKIDINITSDNLPICFEATQFESEKGTSNTLNYIELYMCGGLNAIISIQKLDDGYDDEIGQVDIYTEFEKIRAAFELSNQLYIKNKFLTINYNKEMHETQEDAIKHIYDQLNIDFNYNFSEYVTFEDSIVSADGDTVFAYNENSWGVEITGFIDGIDAPTYLQDYNELIIPETLTDGGTTYNVVGIADNTFMGCGLRRVKIPRSLKWIGENAFADCTELTDVVFYGNYTNAVIEEETEHLYIGATTLDYVVANVQSRMTGGELATDNSMLIGNGAFVGCAALSNVYLPNTVVAIGDAFDTNVIIHYDLVNFPPININEYSIGGDWVSFIETCADWYQINIEDASGNLWVNSYNLFVFSNKFYNVFGEWFRNNGGVIAKS